MVNRLVRCPDPACQSRGRTFSPEAALAISMPRWGIGWDVLCWLGHRRFARPWSVPPRRLALQDTHQIALSDEAIEPSIGLYQTMLAARQQDPARRAEVSRDSASLVRTIDGLPPETGHETLSVVRELMRKRVGCAAPWLSRATQEVQRVIVLARQGAARLAKPVRGWMSDQQEAVVTAMATALPGLPHRYGPNPLRRDVAKPVLDMDSRAQVKRRRTGRGLRAIARGVLAARRQATAPEPTLPHETSQADDAPLSELLAAAAPVPCASSHVEGVRTDSPREATGVGAAGEPGVEEAAGEGVRGDWAAVRGRRNDSQGGPLHPPGVRMSAA